MSKKRNISKYNKYLFRCVAMAILVVAMNANAEIRLFDAALEVRSKSLQHGVDKEEVNLLRVKEGHGTDVVALSLIEKLGLSRDYQSRSDGYSTSLSNDDWVLSVRGEGTKVNYVNQSRVADAENQRKKSKGPISDQEAIELSMDYVTETLKDLIKVNANEIIEPFLRKQHIVTYHSPDGDIVSEDVIGTLVVLKRNINGLPVVGRGSTIMIEFDNDGALVSLSYDWADFVETEDVREQLDRGSVIERARSYNNSRQNSKKVEMIRFVCGYYDQGYNRDAEAPIQTACVMDLLGESEGGTIYTTSNPIPVGVDVEYDSNWNEAKSIIEYGEICYDTYVSEEIFNDVDDEK